MKKMKKLSAALLAVTVAAGLLAGCGGQTGTSAPAETGKAPEASEAGTAAAENTEAAEAVSDSAEPVEVTIAIWGAEDGLSGGENDPIYKTIEEKTGVKLVPQNVTWDDADQKIQLWATNGQLPDIFAGDFVSKNFYGKWIEQGVIRALPDDLSAYPNLKEYLKMDRAVAAMRDGH